MTNPIMIRDLFADDQKDEILAPGAMLLRGFALPHEKPLLAALHDVLQAAPFRHMVTPGGHVMSVAMTNCGAAGWVTARPESDAETVEASLSVA